MGQSTSSHESSAPYQYTPLNENKQEIRLLTLLPGQFSSEIRVCLDVARFKKNRTPKFEAVSYVWGSVENPVNIFIGKSGNKTLSVTQNLAEALPYFRHEDKPRVLWIDAICVDQQNLGERNHQVKRMADIYSRAAKVLIWLGPEAQDSSRALSCLEYIGSKVRYDWNTLKLLPTTEEVHWADVNILLPLAKEDWIAIYRLTDRPWFERLWIRQEVRFASGDSILMCGHHKISWSSTCHAVACIWEKPKLDPGEGNFELFHARLKLVFDLCDSRKKFQLREIIHATSICVCSDPRDRIYSLLSLLPTETICEIEPDYAKSVHEVYRDAVLSTIRTAKMFNLDILTTVEAKQDEAKVSSWVPDLTAPRKANSLADCTGSSCTMHTLPLVANPINLTVEGVIIGVVDKLHPMPCFDPSSTISDFQDLKQVATFALSLKLPLQQHQLEEKQLKAFCRTITANYSRERFLPEMTALPSVTEAEELIKGLLGSSPESENALLRGGSSSIGRLGPVIQGRCSGRSFLLSREGNFGLGPYTTRPSDLVTVLLGCPLPMVLRPCSEGGYQVIGEAYYDSSMYGEALLGPLPEPYVGRYRYDGTNSWCWNYLNQETGCFQAEDPRLGPLPPGWSLRPHPKEDFAQWIVNDETGEEAVPDPRLTSEALRKRGVPLQKLVLV